MVETPAFGTKERGFFKETKIGKSAASIISRNSNNLGVARDLSPSLANTQSQYSPNVQLNQMSVRPSKKLKSSLVDTSH